MSVKIRSVSPHQRFQASRKVFRDFMQNRYVAARVIAGELDHLLPPDMKAELVKKREKDPELVKAAKDRLERGIRAGEVKP